MLAVHPDLACLLCIPTSHACRASSGAVQGTFSGVGHGVLLYIPRMPAAQHLTPHARCTLPGGGQGTFNGVSGGMLLYIALVQLVAEDMSRFTPGRESVSIRLACCLSLILGAGAMCLLAVWA